LPKILIQTVQVLELLDGAKIVKKFNPLSRAHKRYRRQTNDRETTDGRIP